MKVLLRKASRTSLLFSLPKIFLKIKSFRASSNSTIITPIIYIDYIMAELLVVDKASLLGPIYCYSVPKAL